MMTDLPVGTYFRFRYKGEWDFGVVQPGQMTYMLVVERPDETPVTCVWKGKRLEKRHQHKYLKLVHVNLGGPDHGSRVIECECGKQRTIP